MKSYYNLFYMYKLITKRGDKKHIRTNYVKNYRSWRRFKRHIKELCIIFFPKMRIHNFRLKSLNRILRTCCDREEFVRSELIDIFNNNKRRFFDIADDSNIKDKTFIDFFKHKKRFPLYTIDKLLNSILSPF